jgi:hypothetical protein
MRRYAGGCFARIASSSNRNTTRIGLKGVQGPALESSFT